WKGIWKPLAAVGFAATFAAAIFHYVGIGPNRVSKKEEEEALKDIQDSTSSETSKSVVGEEHKRCRRIMKRLFAINRLRGSITGRL
ncbi:formate dehydrogenase N subunit beta transmembrane domain-containing protein, partial [Escherichia coli]